MRASSLAIAKQGFSYLQFQCPLLHQPCEVWNFPDEWYFLLSLLIGIPIFSTRSNICIWWYLIATCKTLRPSLSTYSTAWGYVFSISSTVSVQPDLVAKIKGDSAVFVTTRPVGATPTFFYLLLRFLKHLTLVYTCGIEVRPDLMQILNTPKKYHLLSRTLASFRTNSYLCFCLCIDSTNGTLKHFSASQGKGKKKKNDE